MQNSRKAQILTTIADKTREGFLMTDYKFDDCNAYNLSIILKLNRSNISRILNELYEEGLLIKIHGRPTMYLDRSSLINEFGMKDLSQAYDSLSLLINRIKFSEVSPYNIEKNFGCIGSEFGETLFQYFSELAPMLSLRKYSNYPIIAYGKPGVGKNHFIKIIINYLTVNKMISKNSKTQYIFKSSYELNDFDYEDLFKSEVVIIKIIGDYDNSALDQFWTIIKLRAENRGVNLPITFFTLDVFDENLNLTSISPFNYYIPPYHERTINERIKLGLEFIYDFALEHSLNIKMETSTFIRLLNTEYQKNIRQLKNEVTYSLIKSFENRVNNFLYVRDIHLSRNFLNNTQDDTLFSKDLEKTIKGMFSSQIEVYYEQRPVLSTDFLNRRISMSVEDKPDLLSYVQFKLLTLSTDIRSTIIENRLSYLLNPLIYSSALKFDVQIVNYIYSIFNEYIESGSFPDDFTLDNNISYSTQSNILANRLFDKIELAFNLDIPIYLKQLVRVIIHLSLSYININKITFILISHTQSTSENLARFMNYSSLSRSYFSLEYQEYKTHPIQDTSEIIANFLKHYNPVKEIALITDRDPLNSLPKYISAKIMLPIISFYPISFTLLQTSVNLIKTSKINLMSITKKMIDSKNEIKHFLDERSDKYQSEYIIQMLNNHTMHFFKNFNVGLVNRLFYDVLLEVSKEFNFVIDNGLLVDFLFNGLFCIERTLSKNYIDLKSLTIHKGFNQIFKILKQFVTTNIELRELDLNDNEIYTLVEVITNHVTITDDLNFS